MPRILLASDDDAMREFLRAALARDGHAVTACSDGADALGAFERAGDGAFDLLLTDVVMSGIDGIELARRAAEADPRLQIMFLTGFAGVALTAGARGARASPLLGKPFHVRRILEEIRAAFPAPAR
jgi:two-component system cell cycle response regulator CpdR